MSESAHHDRSPRHAATAGEPAPSTLIVVIGAGPAGSPPPTSSTSTASPRPSSRPTTQVGGISRTVERDGWRFDIGGHRFFTKVARSRTSGTRSSPTRTSCCGPARAASSTTASSSTTRSGPSTRCSNLGPDRGRRAASALLRLGPHPPAEGPDQLRGLARRPLRLAALPHVLQDLHREGLGRAGQRRCRPTGPRSGSRTSSLGNAIVNAAPARSGTRRTSPRSSRSSSTRSTGPG